MIVLGFFVAVGWALGLIAAGVVCAPFVWALFLWYGLKQGRRPWTRW